MSEQVEIKGMETANNIVMLEGMEEYLGKTYMLLSRGGLDERLSYYKRCMEERQELVMEFKNANKAGDLWYSDGEVKIVLPNKEIRGREYNPRYSAKMLRDMYHVLVTSVDEENRTVYVSHAEARQGIKNKMEGLIDENLEKHMLPVVAARVELMYPNLLILNIGGLGIPGFLSIRDWGPAYEFDLNEHVKVGDIIKVAVYDKAPAVGTVKRKVNWTNDVYRCSRKLIVDDPWNKIDEMFQFGDVVEVKCTHKTNGYFNGTLPGVSDLRVYGRIRKEKSKLEWKDIIEGCRYQCYIDKIDKERHGLRVVAFMCLDDVENGRI